MLAEKPQLSFRALGESCPDGVFVHDCERIAYVNPSLLAMLGFHRQEELIGRPLESIVYPDDLSKLKPPELPTARPGQAAAELRCVARDGSVLAVEATGSGCQFGGAPAFVIVIRDVTAARDLADAFRRAQQELELTVEQRTAELATARASLHRMDDVCGRVEVALQERDEQLHQAMKMEAVGRLAGGIAHDFNNMLSVILSYSHMVQLTLPGDSPMQEQLGEMKRAAERAADLTHQLLTFSRRRVLEPKILDPGRLMSGLDKMLRRLVGEDMQLRVSSTHDLANICIDQSQLEQLCVNLVINARDAMPGGGRLEIELSNVALDADFANDAGVTPGQYVMLAISDSGVGMDKATLARIFEPFFTTKERNKGTGLGLSIVHGIVKQSGGHVTVRSQPGAGTTFRLYFPAVAAAASESSPAPVARQVVSSGLETVLLVEDTPSVLSVIRTILQQAGYNVLQARTPRAALALAGRQKQKIALLVTDVVMPQMSGPKLAETLQPQQPQMRTMYISGYTDETLRHHGVLGAAVPFLQKPFTPEGLLRKVRQALEQGGR